jgi:hypothetical protein
MREWLRSGARMILRMATIIIGLADAAVCGFVVFCGLTSTAEFPPGPDIVFGYFVSALFLMTGAQALALAAFGRAPRTALTLALVCALAIVAAYLWLTLSSVTISPLSPATSGSAAGGRPFVTILA